MMNDDRMAAASRGNDMLFIVPRSSFSHHLMARGLTGDPTAPVIGSAGATNRNS
jgi:hypothetical protein